ncbi:MAG: hypothetical protein R2827_04390 [Bdellovibrionales bacterium]
MKIHPTAIVDPKAELASDVVVGPYSIIKGKVTIGEGTVIESHVNIGYEHGVVEIGKNNHLFQSSLIGGPPQDLGYSNEETKLVIGDNNIVREFATLNLGTTKDRGVTSIGNNNLLMAYVHIGHDVTVCNRTVITSCSSNCWSRIN